MRERENRMTKAQHLAILAAASLVVGLVLGALFSCAKAAALISGTDIHHDTHPLAREIYHLAGLLAVAIVIAAYLGRNLIEALRDIRSELRSLRAELLSSTETDHQ